MWFALCFEIKKRRTVSKSRGNITKNKNDDDVNLFETIEKNAVYRNILHLGLYRINRTVGGLEDKMND